MIMRQYITFIVLTIIKINAQEITKLKDHPDLVKTGYPLGKLTNNDATADAIEYYQVKRSADFLRREKFKLYYFNSDGELQWEVKLNDATKLNTSEIIIETDDDYVYVGFFSWFFGTKDRISVYKRTGELVKEMKWDFPFKVQNKIAVFSDESGFKIWVKGGKGERSKKDSKYYMITIKGDQMSAVKTNTSDADMKNMISEEYKKKINKEQFEKLEINFEVDVLGTMQGKIYTNNVESKLLKPVLIYLTDTEKKDKKHIGSLYLEFTLDGSGKIDKGKEFFIDSKKNGSEFIQYNFYKGEYIYINNSKVEKKSLLESTILILDKNGKVKHSNIVVPTSLVDQDSKEFKYIKRFKSIFSKGSIDEINGQVLLLPIEITIKDYNDYRVKYDSSSGNYMLWMNTKNDKASKMFYMNIDSKAKITHFSTTAGLEEVFCKGKLCEWGISIPRYETINLINSETSSLMSFMLTEVTKKQRYRSKVSLLPVSPSLTWIMVDNPYSNTMSIYKIN